jgi:hypothetical protein
MMFGRLTAGIITRFSGHPSNVFYMAAGVQYLVFAGMWWLLPYYPKKNTGLNYFGILWRWGSLLPSPGQG